MSEQPPNPPSLDSLVAEVFDRRWLFEIMTGSHLLVMGSPMLLTTDGWHATVTTPNGVAEWQAGTPALALDGALNGAKRMHGDAA